MSISGFTNTIFPGSKQISRWLGICIGLPSMKTTSLIWRFSRRILNHISSEGVFEVLDYVSTLELKDKHGKQAVFKKFKKIRYLHDNINAYQDQAWGDGKMLINYRCKPGIPVDSYRSGYKTHILISLREVKNRGDIDHL